MKSIDYPKDFLDDSLNFNPYPTLQRNRNYTADLLRRINTNLDIKYQDDDRFCVAIAGSFGRLEASELSDADLFIVYDDRIGKREAEIIRETAFVEARNLNINAPNPRGVFEEPSHLGTLVSNIGDRYDPIAHLSQRMLLLMESKPLYNANFFNSTVKKLLTMYCEYVIYDPKKEFVLLLNEVIKYFRTICVNYQFTFWRENEKWSIRNIKLRHSRIVMYGGLLMLILNASKYGEEKCDYLAGNITLTPLERICHVYLDNEEDPSRFLPFYEKFLSMMSNVDIRQDLVGLGYTQRYTSRYYKELKENSDELCTELARFVLSKQNVWTDAIFEYLLF